MPIKFVFVPKSLKYRWLGKRREPKEKSLRQKVNKTNFVEVLLID